MVPESLLNELDRRLAPVDAARAAAYPGESPARQPVHTCYVPADAVVPGLTVAWGAAALAALDQHGLPDLGLPAALVAEVLPRVRAKLAAEPVEDLRVDAEDGYRGGPDAEDGDVFRAAAVLAAEPGLSPYLGVRAKSLEGPTRRRGVRTLDLFMGGGLDALEQQHGLGLDLDLELQVETPQAVLGADGTTTLARMLHAGAGRVTGLHYGTYDYSAALGLAAAHQSSDHPAADVAKQAMQVAVAGTGARAVDGSTNVLPVGPTAQVHAAWQLHAGLVRRALERGFYQGWDLHPGQLVTRYVATYAFFRAALPAAAARLDGYVRRVAGGVLDEPATARALATVVLRGLDCGALDGGEVSAATGLDRGELDRLAGRRPRAA
ncbi:hypothetical protein SAMN05661080_02322 [Modestobacter sp. DSM 44400]|uniref:DUF6986 family protein n=1 Tax=Modestobacter sp. DSM 44400 TaxID=1550230 RepID=UPI0008963837|nr:aldolase [Modestobacter sp. DSM 44400]SDY10492.1 hypothetical protein SAMN05661080_02322 [Modestobacter sp. DSM 44400]